MTFLNFYMLPKDLMYMIKKLVDLAMVRQDPCDIRFIQNPSLQVQLAAVEKYGTAIRHIQDPSLEVQLAAVNKHNPMLDIQFTSFYTGLIEEAREKYKKEGNGLVKKPLYYSYVGRIIDLTYPSNFIRKFNSSMGFYIRAWITLSFAMFMRGDEIISLQFKHIKLGVDNDGDIALLFTFMDRKSMEAYKGTVMTFFIPENKEEPHIDCFKYINEYFKHLEALNIEMADNDLVFPNRSPNCFSTKKKGSTKYLRDILKDCLTALGIEARDYSNHSLSLAALWWKSL